MEYYEGIFDKYKSEPNIAKWSDLEFPELMWGLGYEMDGCKSFEDYKNANPLNIKPVNTDREKKENDLYYLEQANRQIVGNYLFSYWRGLTHWSFEGFNEDDVEFLFRIMGILENKYSD